jgi:hypothetical protein
LIVSHSPPLVAFSGPSNLLFCCIPGTHVKLKGAIDKPWSHGQRWKAQGFKCGYCSVARDSGDATHLRNHLAGMPGDVVACSNMPRNIRDVILNLVASGKRKKMDTNEHRLYVEQAIVDETYGVARRANIPADEAGQIRWQ